MNCPKCGTETIKILGEDYCPVCSMNILDIGKKTQAKPRGFVKHHLKSKAASRNVESVRMYDFLAAASIIIYSLAIVSIFVGGLDNISKHIFLFSIGLLVVFIAGLVAYRLSPENYIKNSVTIALFLVFINFLFNLLLNFNIVNSLVSLLFSLISYPILSLVGALISKKTEILNL